jgi:hypothetical protein
MKVLFLTNSAEEINQALASIFHIVCDVDVFPLESSHGQQRLLASPAGEDQ